jgi:phosphoglycolate phosphatase-like HAD superfamily hydrolase
MKTRQKQFALAVAFLSALTLTATVARAADPLPSWNDGPAKQSIITFVEKVTKPSSPDFVPIPERIAVFDNDGTLWSEQPMYFQLFFVFDRIKALASQHPEWKDKEPFASVLKGDVKSALAGGERALMEMVMATHTGMTTEEFDKTVKDWIATAKHPKTGRLYTEMVYQPMLEVLAYLRANGFKTFIVSGGGIEFMRAWAEKVYGIPPEQIVGSSVKTKFELRDGKPVLVRLPELNFNDDKGGKPVGINEHIGRRPIAAFGNSDGDLQMLQWTAAGPGARFCLYVHHTDAAREWAYDRVSPVGALDKGLDEANAKGWTVVSTKDDWKTVFPTAESEIIAIDVLLQPDQTMVAKANEINARLRSNYPEGYSLDATHAPHVTMLQRFIRAKDFDAVTAAITKVLATERPGDLQLKATGLLYQIWNGAALTAIVVERTPELTRLQQKVADAVAPFAASGGTEAAFIDTPKGADIVPYVETFVPKSTGANYFPHVTAGVATEAFVKQLKAEPFETVTFRPAGVAIYQLGNFGTASKKLREWDLKH